MLGIAKIDGIVDENGQVFINVDQFVQHLKDNEMSISRIEQFDLYDEDITHKDLLDFINEQQEDLYLAIETIKQDQLK